MNAKSLSALLTELRACEAAREFADGKTLREAWDSCERADWLLWLTGEMAGKKGWPTRKEVVLAACACAETALTFLPKEEERPRKCIEVSRAWANGDASLEQVRVAKRNAYAAAYAAARKTALREMADIVRKVLVISAVEGLGK